VDDLSQGPTGRARFVSAIYLLVGVFLVYDASMSFGPELAPVGRLGELILGIGVVLLAIGLQLFFLAELERGRVALVLMTGALLATFLSRLVLNSGFYPGLGNQSCVWFPVSGGFPIPWYSYQRLYQGSAGPICVQPFFVPPPRIEWYNFISDILFYMSVPLVVLESFRAFKALFTTMREKHARQEFISRNWR